MRCGGRRDRVGARRPRERLRNDDRRGAYCRPRRGQRFVDNGRIATAGGLTSGVDLALHVVSRYFGSAAAERTARYMEYRGAVSAKA